MNTDGFESPPLQERARIWTIEGEVDSFISAAVHDGHELRPELKEYMALDGFARLREEDPYTGDFARLFGTRVVGLRSRFEVDLNRPREAAVYRSPEEAWGLKVYDPLPPFGILERSYLEHDAFYAAMGDFFDAACREFPWCIVLDIHSYNHRREGANGPLASQLENPDINIGTGTMTDRKLFAAVIDSFARDLRRFSIGGRKLDVRENVKFRGGYLAKWLHARYPGRVCVLSVEFKKIFMDEWTGQVYGDEFRLLQEALLVAGNSLRIRTQSRRAY